MTPFGWPPSTSMLRIGDEMAQRRQLQFSIQRERQLRAVALDSLLTRRMQEAVQTVTGKRSADPHKRRRPRRRDPGRSRPRHNAIRAQPQRLASATTPDEAVWVDDVEKALRTLVTVPSPISRVEAVA